jgi:hypothetical protein
MNDFPSNPVYNQQWTDPATNVTYIWNGQVWTSAGQGISVDPTIYTFYDDDADIVGANTTDAINAVLITNGNINAAADLRPGYESLCLDGPGATVNPNVPPGAYLFDGAMWILRPTSTAPVTTVFGRVGNVVSAEGDYSLGQLGDVSTAGVFDGATLIYSGTGWSPGAGVNSINVVAPLFKDTNTTSPTLSLSISSLPVLP